MEIEHIVDKCTGCTACFSICPHDAISMRPDQWGYLRPEIDHSACVACGLCDKTCPEIHPTKRKTPLAVMAAVADPGASAQCSSGGVASSVTTHIIDAGGIVYGCMQDEGTDIIHSRVSDKAGIEGMKGSRYVQSAVGVTFRQCREDLRQGKEVVYIGTPCQIAGLKKYLGKDYPNLCTIDLVCHGVPSQQLLDDELKHLRRKHSFPENARIGFRDKSTGKVKFGFYLYQGGEKIHSSDYPKNFYISGFMSGLFFRPNCFDCPYASEERVGDITLGDFWGLGKELPSKLNPSAGVSLVMVNTPKGNGVMDKVKDSLMVEHRSLDEAVKGNTQLRQPFTRPSNYDTFHDLYAREGYEAACRTYLSAYIRENTGYMLIEEHPTLMLPYRVYLKIKGLFRK